MKPIETKDSIAVIGAGSWGTALAVLLARNSHPVSLWGRNRKKQKAMQQNRCNETYLPDIPFPDNLSIHLNIETALENINCILLVVPSKGFKQTLEMIKPYFQPHIRIALASKGLEPKTFSLLHDVVHEVLGEHTKICAISGPTFAKEVAKGLPTALTVASGDELYAHEIAAYLSNDRLRAYTSTDIIGVELGGAIKNVIAIAAGIADGLGFGANTRAAVITRGLAEITRLGIKLGGKQETFMGLAGLGDLVLTCTDNQSRNRRVGIGLAKGKSMEQILQELGQVAEGVESANKIHQLAIKHGIEMPIVEQVNHVIQQNKSPMQAVQDLLGREVRSELY